MRLLWLADVLRNAGLTVHEYLGWKTRGYDEMNSLAGVICHATAGARNGSTSGEISVLLNGSATAPPPISQTYLARNGDWHVLASGICYHAGSGGLWGVSGNDNVIGVEAGNDNKGEPWPPDQYNSYVAGVAAILAHLNLPASRAGAHREWNPAGKSDPVGINMSAFRVQVAQLIETGGDDMFEETDRAMLKNTQGRAAEVYPIKLAVTESLPKQVDALATSVTEIKTQVAELIGRPTANMPTAAEVAAEIIRQLKA